MVVALAMCMPIYTTLNTMATLEQPLVENGAEQYHQDSQEGTEECPVRATPR